MPVPTNCSAEADKQNSFHNRGPFLLRNRHYSTNPLSAKVSQDMSCYQDSTGPGTCWCKYRRAGELSKNLLLSVSSAQQPGFLGWKLEYRHASVHESVLHEVCQFQLPGNLEHQAELLGVHRLQQSGMAP